MVILETMQAALSKEPQVAISTSMKERPTHDPQNVSVDVVW